MDSIIVSDYLTPILVFGVLSFITLFGILYVLLYQTLYRSCDIKDKEVKEKSEKLMKEDLCNIITKYGYLEKIVDSIVDALNNISDRIDDLDEKYANCINDVEESFCDDIGLVEGAILELNDRLNLIEEEIKKIKKVGKKNGSKN